MSKCCIWSLVLVLLINTSAAVAQTPQYGFRIHFADKDNTPYTIGNPAAFLTQRAIDRRTRLNIPVDQSDLPVTPAYVDTALALPGAKLHMISKWFNYMVLLLNDSSQILNLQGKPYISRIEYVAFYPTGVHKPAKTNIDPLTGTLPTAKVTGNAAYYGQAYNQTSTVNGDYLHDIGWKGEGKLIAVLDEGFESVDTGPAFDSMRANGRLVDQYNYSKASANVYVDGTHGTNSLSAIAGNMPGTYVGSAPDAMYALYITEIRGSEQVIEMDNIMAAAERADSIGADIITISLGYDQFNLPSPSYSLKYADIDGKSTIAAKAANTATSKGILFIASAGNEGGGSWNYILTPGDADSALTIGSVGLNKVPAGSSGYGPNAAGHIKPDVCMVGQPGYVMSGSNVPFAANGTSIATPQIAGWAACLMQASGTFTPFQIRDAIQKSANVYNNPGVQLGYGVPNFHYALQLLNIPESKGMPNADEWAKAGPVPFVNIINLKVYRELNGQLDVTITDISGKVVFAQQERVLKGTQTVQLDVHEIPSGVYFLKAIADEDEITIKVMKR